MSWPALGTDAVGRAASAERRHRRDRRAAGDSAPALGAASSPPAGRWASGRYQTSVGLAASERPTISASRGSMLDVSTSSATSGARRSRSTSAGISAGSSTTLTATLGAESRASQSSAVSVAPEAPARRRRLVGRRRRRGGRRRSGGAVHCPAPPASAPGVELQLGQDPDGGVLIGLLQGAEARDVELDRHVALDRDQLAARAARCRPARGAPRGSAWR